MENFSREFRKELREAQREMERNKRLIDSASPLGTPAGKKSDWSRKRKKHKGVSS